jgi:hypothetical protein
MLRVSAINIIPSKRIQRSKYPLEQVNRIDSEERCALRCA